MMIRTVSLFVLLLLFPVFAYSLDCPKMPEQTNKDWDVQVKAAVGKIGPVKGAELETKTKSAVTDLMGKLPQADKIYIEQMFFAAYCSGLRDDKTISEAEKAGLIRTYTMNVHKTLSEPPAKKKISKESPAIGPGPEEARLALSKLSLPFTGQAFLERAEQNDTYAVKLYLAAGMNPNQPLDVITGVAALTYAIKNENRELITALLARGADVNVWNTGYTPFEAAAARGMTDVVELMLAKGARDATIQKAVVSASGHGNLETLKLLLNKGGNTSDALSKALLAASWTNSKDMDELRLNEAVRLLLDHKANIETTDATGLTPLMRAASCGKPVITRTLLDAGAAVNTRCECRNYLDGGWSALLLALENDHFEAAKILINRGADCTIANNRGETTLMYAAKEGNSEIMSALIEKGADLNKKDYEGTTALMIAAKSANSDAVRILIERGALLREKDKRGKTALMYALELGDGHERKASTVQLLKTAGAN